MGVSENIVKLRTLTNTTQQQLADIAGVSRSAVSLWEIGKAEPRMGAVQAMADHFGIRKANIIEEGGMDYIAASVTGKLYSTKYDMSHLSDDERRLLDLYRSCTPQGREYLLGVAQVTSGLFGRE